MSHKHSNTWEEIYSFVHSLWVHIKFRMGCSSNYKSRIKSFFKLPWLPVFRSFDLLESHNQSIVQAKIKAIKKIDKSFAKLLLNYFDNFHYSVNDYTFIPIIAKLETKYCKNNIEWSQGWFSFLHLHELFFQYYSDSSFAVMGLKDTSWVSGLIPQRITDMKEVTLLPPAIIKERECHLDLSSTHQHMSTYGSCGGFRGLLRSIRGQSGQ